MPPTDYTIHILNRRIEHKYIIYIVKMGWRFTAYTTHADGMM